MAKLQEALKWVGYTLLALVAIGVVATSSLVFLAIGATIAAVVIGGMIIWFVAAMIKESWDSRRSR